MRIAITGAATGIGAEVAKIIKMRGAEIVAFDIKEPTENVDQWIETDFGNPASVENAVSSVDGSFDALINNAGIPPREGQTELVLQVNYFGLMQFKRAMLEKMNPDGSIVNVASRAGAMWRENIEEVGSLISLQSVADLPRFVEHYKIDHVRAYNLSKEAVIVSTFQMTEELINRDLRINCVSPAAVSTGILEDFVAAFGERVAKAIARVGRAGKPAEIAEVICFLASPESRWIKGQDITIDGGMTALAISDGLAS